MGAIYLGNTRISPFVHTNSNAVSNNSSDFVSFIVYSNNGLSIRNSTINGVLYEQETFSLDNHKFIVAIVPKNTSFSYSIGTNNWTNGTGTLNLSSDYVLELIKGSGNPAVE